METSKSCGLYISRAREPYTYQKAQRSPGDVPTAVRNLLVATKRLQESLRLWSLDRATENEVSNVYVTVGTEFNVVINAFAQHRIELR